VAQTSANSAVIDQTFRLDRYAEALIRAEQHQRLGKVLITFDG
jgi:hypothetical protein